MVINIIISEPSFNIPGRKPPHWFRLNRSDQPVDIYIINDLVSDTIVLSRRPDGTKANRR